MELINFKNLSAVESERGGLSTIWNSKWETYVRLTELTNGGAIMSEKEAAAGGVQEAQNFLTAFRDLSLRVSALESTYFITRRFAQVTADFVGLTDDEVHVSETMTRLFNKLIINTPEMSALVTRLAGVAQHIGAVPVSWMSSGAILPLVSVNLLIPMSSSLVPSGVPYFFSETSVDLPYLRRISKSAKGAGVIKSKAVDDAIKYYEEKEAPGEPICIVNYYEVQKNGKVNLLRYFKDSLLIMSPDADAAVLSFEEGKLDSIDDWIQILNLSASVGADGTLATARGIAEISEPSTVAAEVLLQASITGETFRSRPRLQYSENISLTDLQGWDPSTSMYVPPGVASFAFQGSTGNIQAPLSHLSANRAGILGSDMSGVRSNELRVQSLERAQNTGQLNSVMTNKWYGFWDKVLTVILKRVLLGDIDEGDPLKKSAEKFRRLLKNRFKIKLETVAEIEDGSFEWLCVEANRLGGNGDPNYLQTKARFIVENINSVSPDQRNLALRTAATIQTGDSEMAEAFYPAPARVNNDQRRIADMELASILSYGSAGKTYPKYPSDVDEYHLEQHLGQMEDAVTAHTIIEWNEYDVPKFTGLQAHAFLHLEDLPKEKKQTYLPIFTRISQAAQQIVSILQRQAKESGQRNALSAKDQAELELKARQQGIDVDKELALRESRSRRAELAERKQQHAEETRLRESVISESENVPAPPEEPPISEFLL